MTHCTWEEVHHEALQKLVDKDCFIKDVLQKYIIDHQTFADAVICSLSIQFAGLISLDKWRCLFASVCHKDTEYHEGMGTIEEMGLLDLGAISQRDPASEGYVNPFLYFKGFKALLSHRIAHALWNTGRKDAARAIQSRCSELYAVDIHPAAIIGSGMFIDHGTGIVIGETAVIGQNCSFLHGVTLGSTGKDRGDRHPKIGDNVLVGCGVTILGNIKVGNACKIGSGSIVLHALPCGATAVGNPARIVGRSNCACPGESMDVALKDVVTEEGKSFFESFIIHI